MKIFLNAALLLGISLIVSVGIISCKKDDNNTTSDKVELLSFGPTGAQHGDTLRFFGSNMQKVTEISLTGATVMASSFVSQTAEIILIIVPVTTEQGFVTLKTPDGDVVSKTRLNLMVTPSVSFLTKEARPGENITIRGNYLNWVTAVTFAKDKAETTFVSKSLTELVVKVPVDAESGTLFLTYGGTEPLTLETDSSLKVFLPLITTLSPNPVLHGTNLTISGTNLDLATAVIFSEVLTPVTVFESQSATRIVAKVPGGAKKGRIMLVAASGVQTISELDLDVPFPSLATLTPNPVDPGGNITITGTNLNLVASVAFDNAPAVTTFVSQTANQLVVKVPTGALRGKVSLAALNSTLTEQSPDILEINGSIPPPTMALPFYNDAVTSNWNGWIGGGWGGASNRDNTSRIREGSKSIKIDYVGGWGSPLQLGGATVNLSGYTTFKVSIFGGAGSSGKNVSLGINGADSRTITLIEGTWTDYSFPISGLTNAAVLDAIIIKEFNGSGGFTIYVDAMGLN